MRRNLKVSSYTRRAIMQWESVCFIICNRMCTYISNFLSVEVGFTFLCSPSALGVGYG